MRVIAAALVAASLTGIAGAAYAAAASATATGTIRELNAVKKTVTLDNGATYDLAKGVSLASLKVGEKVKVIYSQSGKMMDATAITPAA